MVERRFLTPALPEVGHEVLLTKEVASHVAVLRLDPGDALVLFDGRGAEADARIVSIDRAEVRCVIERVRLASDGGLRIVLCQCLPKGKKLESIVRATTELGVSAVRLVSSARSISKPGEDRGDARAGRLRKIAEEAARQSIGARVPEIVAPRPFAEVVRAAPPEAARLVFAPDAKDSLRALAPRGPEVWVLIGPEGGLSAEELAIAADAGFAHVRLFDTVLRVETAAPVAVALVRYCMMQ